MNAANVTMLIEGQMIPAEIRHNPDNRRVKYTLYACGAPLVCQSKELQEILGRIHGNIVKTVESDIEIGTTETTENNPEPGVTVVEDIGPGIDEDITERRDDPPPKKRGVLDWLFGDDDVDDQS